VALTGAAVLALVAPAGAAASVSATEGAQFSGAVEFPSCAPASAITINWGDGSSSAGTYDGTNVNGTHTYAEEGSYSGTVTFNCVTGAPATDPFTATVDDASLTAAANTFTATATRQFSGQVAAFTDADPGATASDYAATIDWGDGTTSAGTVSVISGGFAVNGTHTYATSGDRSTSVTITDQSTQGGAGGASPATGVASGTAHVQAAPPLFNQCPPVGSDNGCQFLIVVTDKGSTVKQDPNQPAYEGADDSLIGIQNNSSKPIQALPMSSSGLFSFENDGICNPGSGPIPSGCRPAPRAPAGTKCGPQGGSCSFPAPSGQPKGYKEPGALVGNTQNGYEGPTTWFSNVSTALATGHVNFSPAIAPGGSTYFTLEEPPSATALKVGRPTNAPLPAPVLGKSFNVQVASGTVLIRLPHTGKGKAGFVKLTTAQQLPAGTQVDTRHGAIKLVAARPHSKLTEDGKFGGAIFKITQSARGVGITTLRLLEGLFSGAPSFATCRRGSHRVLQTLRASDRRHFRSRGGYASATVRGTRWITIDRCDGTLIIVQRGSVVVDDFVRHIRVILHAGHRYFASASRH
jgi:hypothetical protein